MDLETFIKESLLQIYRGVDSANAEIEKARSQGEEKSLPAMFLLKPGAMENQGGGVHFDVAVSASSEKSVKAGGKGSLLSVVSLDAGGEQSASSEEISRVRFSVQTSRYHG